MSPVASPTNGGLGAWFLQRGFPAARHDRSCWQSSPEGSWQTDICGCPILDGFHDIYHYILSILRYGSCYRYNGYSNIFWNSSDLSELRWTEGFFSCFGTQFCPKWSGHRKCSRFHALRMWFIVGLMLFCTILAPLRLGHVMFLVTAPIRGRARVSFFLCLHFRSVPLTVSTFPLHIPLCLFFCTCLMQGMWVGWGGVGGMFTFAVTPLTMLFRLCLLFLMFAVTPLTSYFALIYWRRHRSMHILS